MSHVELYSMRLCPYAHRSRLTLIEKQIPFTLIEIDLHNKPANFEKISPTGKVPALKYGTHRLWQSAVINEYLEEEFPMPPLLPKGPMLRAQARLWIHFADTRLFAVTHKLLFTSDPLQQAKLGKELTDCLQWIEQEGLQKLTAAEPYWLGSEMSLVDLTYYPWFEQVSVLEHFCGFKFPTHLDRLHQWRKTVANRESVRSIAKPPKFYLEHYGKLVASL
ncbi:glutathione S-transferase family protein [Myxacorys almedinensis]|uniref:Glutathione S-transferase family protein n=1 Tax=Myxacorys almedinensis A TaxID=2690445 RepID=A0A8J7Z7C4_9CYAN|nr:glutathione S-transferase family protein [Myxacorys almedinensis]NDJ19456.1 glutathione S-transferase family protein [Myxacorys almedinensis A]